MNPADFSARFVFTGGRAYPCQDVVAQLLGGLVMSLVPHVDEHRPILFAQGGARGLDEHVRAWTSRARRAGLPIELVTFTANWDEYGLAAGPKRNRAMLDAVQPHIVFAFEGDRGTRDCVSAALQRKLPVVSVPELTPVTKVYRL